LPPGPVTPAAPAKENPGAVESFNPIYEVSRTTEQVVLRRRATSALYESEFQYPVPPAETTLKLAELRDASRREWLRRRAIIVDLPRSYGALEPVTS
jgi:hypothetical protein